MCDLGGWPVILRYFADVCLHGRPVGSTGTCLLLSHIRLGAACRVVSVSAPLSRH